MSKPKISLTKGKHPCTFCQARKVKCDRSLPACQNCIERNVTELCEYDDNGSRKRARLADDVNLYDKKLFNIWNQYERLWIHDTLGQCQQGVYMGIAFPLDVSEYNNTKDFYGYECLFSKESIFKILDHSLERLGWLYFGFFTDISELPYQMERYWNEYESMNINLENEEATTRQTTFKKSADQILWDLVLRSVIVMTIYYMPAKSILSLVDIDAIEKYPLDFSESSEGVDELKKKYEIFDYCLRHTLNKVLRTIFILPPDVRTLQIFLILSNTNFLQIYPSLGNNILVHCIHLAKVLGIKDFKLKINDSGSTRLQKLSMHNIWFRLSTVDYMRSSPNKIIALHTDNSSALTRKTLFTHYSIDSIDVYDVESNLEVLRWKITSLDRDLEVSEPSLKTLKAMKELLGLLDRKTSVSNDASFNTKFESFFLKLQCNFVMWKILRYEFMQYGVTNGLQKLCCPARRIIALVANFLKEDYFEYTTHPFCVHILCVIAGFFSFYCIFHEADEVRDLRNDAVGLLKLLFDPLRPVISCFFSNLSRLEELRHIWKSVEITDQANRLVHPVMYILKTDIITLKRNLEIISGSLKDANYQETFKDKLEIDINTPALSSDFLEVVREFNLSHPLDINGKMSRQNN